MSDQYDADYYLRGRESGKSLYENYRWMPDLTTPMVQAIIAHLGIARCDSVFDFGCARGYTVKAFRQLGYEACGMDASQWAIANCDPEVKPYVFLAADDFGGSVDWCIAKDVLEHVEKAEETVWKLMNASRRGVFAIVPLSLYDGQSYVVADYEKDVTHIHRLCLSSWARMFMRPGWTVTGAYELRGVKDNYARWERGNGFITARRIV